MVVVGVERDIERFRAVFGDGVQPPAPTVDLRVDFHRAAAPGDLRAVGRIIRMGGTFSTAEASVYDSENRLIASGRGLYYTAPPKK